jgi:hypothetical protein
MKNCPICNTELTENYIEKSNYGIEEYQYQCKNCEKYIETYVYGGTEICIGDFMTGFTYLDGQEKIKKLFKMIDKIGEIYGEEMNNE